MSLVRNKKNSHSRHGNSMTQEDDFIDDSDDDIIQNEELKKVKVLKILKEKIIVSGNEYIKEQD